ncbi:hypothetical protein [Acetobacter ghanensis]|nr:hypothetical protein [Acetobacter ghanensis]NHO39794.1 hypothetical protein [Acetobacter ghanensis]
MSAQQRQCPFWSCMADGSSFSAGAGGPVSHSSSASATLCAEEFRPTAGLLFVQD